MRWFYACCILVSLLAAGCGPSHGTDYRAVKLVPARGLVTLDGQPLAGAVILFEAEDGQFAYALTDSSGKYTMQFDSVKRGVTSGMKTVRISTSRKIPGLSEDDSHEWGDAEISRLTASADERVPARYNQQSELTVEVMSGRRVYDFDLVSE